MGFPLNKAACYWRRNIESRSIAQHLDDAISFIYLIARIDEPDAQSDGIGA